MLQNARSLALALVLAGLLEPAVAQAGPGERRAVAEALFQEARASEQQGNDAVACEKYAESFRIDPAGGTILALALCHERISRYASAWSEFRDAIAFARRDGREDRERIAREHATAVRKLAPQLVIEVPQATRKRPGLTVRLDGTALGAAAWDTPLPVDPGEHVIALNAPGYERWQTTVSVSEPEKEVALAVPELVPSQPAASPLGKATPPASSPARAPSSTAVATVPAEQSRTMSFKRPLGYSLLGAGAVLLGTGAYFGARALSKSDDVCEADTCPADEKTAYEEYRRAARIANATVATGIVSAGVGLVLLLIGRPVPAATASGRTPATWTLQPQISGSEWGLSLTRPFAK